MISKNIKSTTLRKYLPNKLFILKTIIILFFITISQNTTIQVLENTKQKTVTKHILRFQTRQFGPHLFNDEAKVPRIAVVTNIKRKSQILSNIISATYF